jgi:hypothetical protein
LSTISGILLATLPNAEWLIPYAVFGCMMGVTAAFNLVWMVILDAFPPLFVSFCFASASVLAHVITIGAPEVAEFKKPIPIIIYCIINGAALLLSFFLRIKKQKRENEMFESM